MWGQLVSVWEHVMLMCNRYLVVVCVIRALLSLLGLDDISMLAIRVTDSLLQIGREIEFEPLSKYHHALPVCLRVPIFLSLLERCCACMCGHNLFVEVFVCCVCSCISAVCPTTLRCVSL